MYYKIAELYRERNLINPEKKKIPCFTEWIYLTMSDHLIPLRENSSL